jgi:protein TonB
VAGYYHSLTLPWSPSGDEDRRFRTILLWSVIVGMVLSAAIPFLPLSEIIKDDFVEVPPRLAKLILERQEPPPPPRVEAPKPKPEPKKEAEPKPQPEKPKKVDATKKVVKKETPKPPVNTAEKAREKAQHAGILAFQDTLADLRDNSAVQKVNKTGRLSTSGQTARKVERSMITSQQAGATSGGINTASLSRDTGDVGLVERATATVTSPVQPDASATRETRKGRKMSRTMEEIQMVFDRNKGVIYAMYNRALREDPSLQGKLVLRLTISPSGKVITCELVSNELGSQALGHKVVQRVKLFNFGAKDVDEMTVTYPIDFLPA